MAMRIVRTRVCDVQDCTDQAEHLELSRAGDVYAIDLCSGHQDFVMGLPWKKMADSASTPAERSAARMARKLEARIRIPEGFDVEAAKRRVSQGTELP
jgi:hypothetical protein